jgi:uncharacterized protein YjiS (DUF1127 family)
MTTAPAATFSQLSPEARPFAWLRSGIAGMHRRMEARHQYRHLLTCDDETLSDVGLTRADVLKAMNETR